MSNFYAQKLEGNASKDLGMFVELTEHFKQRKQAFTW